MPERQVYFNENDSHAAQWLRNLYPEAVVDPRSIVDVRPGEVAAFRRAHFFGGIGLWEYALGLAGWPVDRPVWTGSCPCQPFSSAGRRKGTADARHLWPEFLRLIAECQPATILGEQVQSKDGRAWLSGVRADLEALGYAVGAIDTCAASKGAPHIRQRLYWVADLREQRLHRGSGGQRSGRPETVRNEAWDHTGNGCSLDGLGQSRRARLPRRARQHGDDGPKCAITERAGGDVGGVGHSFVQRVRVPGCGADGGAPEGMPGTNGERERLRDDDRPAGPVGPWSDYDIIPCRDGKARRTQRGLFPLVDGTPFRLADGRTREGVSRSQVLKGIGNAIVPAVAAEFIRAFLECESMGTTNGQAY